MKQAQFLPFLSGVSAESVSFSKDGQWVAYSSYPDATLWKSKLDGSERIQLSYPPLRAFMPRWSPDAKEISFYSFTSGRLYIVSADGGSPRELIPEDTSFQHDNGWSPDGNRIVFGGAASDPNSSIRIVGVSTKQISMLAGAKGLFAPRRSPDSRYIAAMPFASRRPQDLRFCDSKMGGDREDQHGIPKLVEEQRLRLLPA
jgi:Tol biopolymer transport system component